MPKPGRGEDLILQLLGSRIKAARTDQGITQAELAKYVGLTRPSIANIEAGRQDIGAAKLILVLYRLKVDLSGMLAPRADRPR